MGVTEEDVALLQKLPQQWRGILVHLLHKSARREHQVSMVAMQCSRRTVQSSESWDALLTALSKMVPSLATDGKLQFQPLLWSFPDPFIQGFLLLLLRLQDVVSADSLHRFLHSSLASHTPASVKSTWDHLSSSVAHRSGSSHESVSERSGVNVHGGDRSFSDPAEIPCFPEGKSDCGTAGVQARDRTCVADVESKPSQSLRKPGETKGFHSSPQIGNCEAFHGHEYLEDKRSSVPVTNSDSYLIILDSDEEEDSVEKNNKAAVQTECKKLTQENCQPDQREIVGENVVVTPDLSKHADVGNTERSEGAGEHLVEKLKEVFLSSEQDTEAVDIGFLLTLSLEQLSSGCRMLGLSDLEEAPLCVVMQRLVTLSDKLSHSTSSAIVNSIIHPVYRQLETASRQTMSCLSDLARAYPQQMASAMCDCLEHCPCSAGQSEAVSALCKDWQPDIVVLFLRKLCASSVQLDDNLLTVMQAIVSRRPSLTPDLLDCSLQLLETGSTALAKSAKYGRLILSFVKTYKTQMDSSHSTTLQSIVNIHSSVVRRSLRNLVDTLH